MAKKVKEKTSLKKWLPVIILSLGLFIVIIDTTIINVSITNVIQDLDTSFSTIQTVITMYALVMASLLILGGKLGDIFGRKNMFILGMFLFGLGAFVAAISPNVLVLVIGWSILEGIGGALMMPSTQALIMDIYKGKDRSIAFGIWGGVAGLAVAFGPLAGGFLSANASWRWAFGLEVGVVVLVIIAAIFGIQEKNERRKVKVDIVGAILSAIGLGSLVYGILEARVYGWVKEKKVYEISGQALDFGSISAAFVFMLIGILCLVGMVLWIAYKEKKKSEPLFSLQIFKFRDFNYSLLTIMLLLLPMSGIMFTLPVFWQVVRGYDAFQTGLTFLPYSVALLVCAPLMGKLSHTVPSKYIIQAGILVSALGLVLMNLQISENSTWLNMSISVGIFGAGMACFMSQIQHVILSTVDPKFIGEASGLNSAVRQLGGALGTAILGSIFLTAITSHLITTVNNSDKFPEAQKSAIVQQLETTDTLDSPKEETTPENSAAQSLMTSYKNDSIIDANKDVFLVGAGITLVSFLFSFGIPKKIEESYAEDLAVMA